MLTTDSKIEELENELIFMNYLKKYNINYYKCDENYVQTIFEEWCYDGLSIKEAINFIRTEIEYMEEM